MIDLNQYPNLMKEGCPWVDLRTQYGLPNVKWCEETLCKIIAEPANTWSNLAYVIVGIALYFAVKKEKSKVLRYYPQAAMWVGWTSFIYHMAVMYLFQVLDFVGMYVYFFMLILQNFARLGYIKPGNEIRNLWIATIVTTLISSLTSRIGFPVQLWVVGMIGVVLWSEWYAWKTKRNPKNIQYGFFFGTFATITAAAYVSFLDVSRHWCEPQNHVFQGHASWHVFGAIALCLSYFHYRQFYDRETGAMITT